MTEEEKQNLLDYITVEDVLKLIEKMDFFDRKDVISGFSDYDIVDEVESRDLQEDLLDYVLRGYKDQDLIDILFERTSFEIPNISKETLNYILELVEREKYSPIQRNALEEIKYQYNW